MTAPVNNTLVDAIGLAAGTTQSVVDNTGATKQTGEGGTGQRTVWWTWRSPTSGLVTMTTAGSLIDTILAVWLGPAGADPVTDPAALTLVAEDDDAGPGDTSSVTFTAILGRLYYVQAGGYDTGQQGTIVLNFPSPLSVPGAGDPGPEGTSVTVLSGSTGQQWDLTAFDDRQIMLDGPQGFRLPPVELVGTAVPGRAGLAPTGATLSTQDVTIPLHWWDTTRAALLARRRAFDAALLRDAIALSRDPRSQLTSVIVTERGDRPRVIRGLYVGGAEGTGDASAAGLVHETWSITLRCPHPHWRALEPERLEWAGSASAATFFPILPLTLSTTPLLGSSVVAVAGDLETYPVWTITGPCTAVEAQSAAGTWRVEYPLPSGRYLTVNTTPGRPSVVLDSGLNLWPYLVTDDMWPLVPGVQTVEVSADDASPATVIAAEFYPEWATA